MTEFVTTRLVRTCKSYATKSGMDTRGAAKTIAGAMFGDGPKFTEVDSFMVREWKSSESSQLQQR
jgi:hypothetical protein